MDLKELQSIDFSSLNIEKYIDWLKSEYDLFCSVCVLPSIDKVYKDYTIRKFLANNHYLNTRGELLPKGLELAYDERISHFKAVAESYSAIPLRLIGFSCVSHEKNYKGKKYGFFTSKELKEIKILRPDFDSNIKYIEKHRLPDFIEDVEKGFKSTPLSRLDFYRYKRANILEEGFKYLRLVMAGHFIYNLNECSVILDFFDEVSRIKEIQYLDSQIIELSKPKKKQKSLTLNPNFEDKEWQIKTISESSKSLFVSSFEQWENLFSDSIKIFNTPIELEKGVTKADLRVFIDNLKYYGLIRVGSFLKILQEVNAFSIKGKVLTAYDYKTANNGKNYPNTRNSNKVKDVFRALKLKD